MEWVKKHVDTVIVIGGIVGCFLWMSSKMHEVEARVTNRIISIEKDIAIIKSVLIMENRYPKELARVREDNGL